jgi:hypothetical protein
MAVVGTPPPPMEKNLHTHNIGGWVDPIAGRDVLDKNEISYP